MIPNVFHVRFPVPQMHRLSLDIIHHGATTRALTLIVLVALQHHRCKVTGRENLRRFRLSLPINSILVLLRIRKIKSRSQYLAVKHAAGIALVFRLDVLHIQLAVHDAHRTALDKTKPLAANGTGLISFRLFRQCNRPPARRGRFLLFSLRIIRRLSGRRLGHPILVLLRIWQIKAGG